MANEFPLRRTNSPGNEFRYLSVGRKVRPSALFLFDGRIDFKFRTFGTNSFLSKNTSEKFNSKSQYYNSFHSEYSLIKLIEIFYRFK